MSKKFLTEGQLKFTKWPEIFKDVKDVQHLNKQGRKYYEQSIKEGTIIEEQYAYHNFQGDLGELMTMVTFKVTDNPRFRVSNITRIKDDNGIDFEGVWDIENLWAPIQTKWTENQVKLLTASGSNLSSFSEEILQVLGERGIPLHRKDGSPNFKPIIFTYAKGLHHYTKDKKCRWTKPLVIGHEVMMQELVGPKFWHPVYELVASTQPGFKDVI